MYSDWEDVNTPPGRFRSRPGKQCCDDCHLKTQENFKVAQVVSVESFSYLGSLITAYK